MNDIDALFDVDETVITTLPDLVVEISGMVKHSNLDQFKDAAMIVFDGIKTDLKTDEDFAEAEETVKWCGDVEAKLKAAKQTALNQTASIDALFKTVDELTEICRQKRLTVEKLVKAQKETIRADLVRDASGQVESYCLSLKNSLPQGITVGVFYDFHGAIKGKKSIKSCEQAIQIELARAIAEANQTAELIKSNYALLVDLDAVDLVPDFSTHCLKPAKSIRELIETRKAAAAARAEAEREKIRQEELAKIARMEAEEKRKAAQEAARIADIEAKKKALDDAEKLGKSWNEKLEDSNLSSLLQKYQPETMADVKAMQAAEAKRKAEAEAKAAEDATKHAAVLDYAPVIAEFLKAKIPEKESSKIRSILIEYEKFKSIYKEAE